MSVHHFWLRAEVKPSERRTPLTPEQAKTLLEKGHKVTVEKSPLRCFKDEDYSNAGCEMVELGKWKEAPSDAVILGLKELPENDTSPLSRNHIFFGHCYKYQGGWKELLQRFNKGNGTLWDLEFLKKNGRRVAAFGKSAGLVGMAVGFLSWLSQTTKESVSQQLASPYESMEALVKHVKGKLSKVEKTPKVIVIGALGRVGSGAVEFAKAVGIEVTQWDLEETKPGGPFKQILDYDIFVNCIYLSPDVKIPPFITKDLLKEKRRLSLLVDISCDASNPANPVPVYQGCSTFADPVINVIKESDSEPAFDVVSIDHLPSLVPSDSSNEFTNDLFPHILEYNTSDVWQDALKLFKTKVQEAIQ